MNGISWKNDLKTMTDPTASYLDVDVFRGLNYETRETFTRTKSKERLGRKKNHRSITGYGYGYV